MLGSHSCCSWCRAGASPALCEQHEAEQEEMPACLPTPPSPSSCTAPLRSVSPPQPKGADRKQKTDREKMEKRTPHEKEKYQPSYETTILTEVGTPALQHNAAGWAQSCWVGKPSGLRSCVLPDLSCHERWHLCCQLHCAPVAAMSC